MIAGAGGDVGVQLIGGTNNTIAGNFIGTDTSGTPLSRAERPRGADR